MRSLPRYRLFVGGLAGGGLSAGRQAQRGAARHCQPDETEFDEIADLVLHDDIGAALAPFIAH